MMAARNLESPRGIFRTLTPDRAEKILDDPVAGPDGLEVVEVGDFGGASEIREHRVFAAGARNIVDRHVLPYIVRWEIILVVVAIHEQSHHQLFLVADARDGLSTGAGRRQRRKQHRGEDCNNGDHDEEFYERKGTERKFVS